MTRRYLAPLAALLLGVATLSAPAPASAGSMTMVTVRVRRDQLDPVRGKAEVLRTWRQLGDEEAARMYVREKVRRHDLLRDMTRA